MTLFNLMARILLDTKDYEKGINEAKNKSSGLASGLKSTLGAVGKAAAGAVAAGAAAVGKLVQSSVSAYSQYEQLVGGTQLMFGDAYDYIMDKSREAYKNVQMSQNDYLTQVNGFATGLKTSLGGNEQAAAELADKIITAEADIVAATGNSQENIQNAFNGIMKGNYTMLDNLQIGIKPTKEGMQEVIDKVNDWNAAQGNLTNYTIDSLADCEAAVVDYVSMIGYSGYAQNEAAGTIQGSLSMMKGAWQDLVAGLSNSEADLDSLISNVIDSALTLVDNILPTVTKALSSIAQALPKIAPVLGQTLINLITQVLPDLLTAAIGLVNGLVTAIIDNVDLLLDAAFEIINTLVFGLLDSRSIQMLINSTFDIIASLADGLFNNLPTLLPAVTDIILTIVETLTTPENIETLLMSALKIIMAIADGLVESAGMLIERAPIIIENLITGIIEALPKLWDMGKSLVSSIWEGIKSAFGGGKNTEISDGLSPDLDSAAAKAENSASRVRTSFETNLGGLGENSKVTKGFDSTEARLEKFAGNVETTVSESASNMSKSIRDSISSLPKSTESSFDTVTSGATESAKTVEQVWGKMPEYFKGIYQRIASVFGQTPRYFGTIFASARNSVQAVWGNVPSWFSSVWSNIANAFRVSEAYKWGADMMDNFINGINSRMEILKSTIEVAAKAIENLIGFSEPKEGPLSNFHTYAPDMMQLFAQGIRDNEGLVRSELERAFDFQNIVQGGFGEVTYSATGGSPFGTMAELLNRYLPQLANLKVVMDSGTVVGELRDKMNQSLGEVGRYDKRGLATT